MRSQYTILRIIELLVVLSMIGSATYSLLNNVVYSLIIVLLQHLAFKDVIYLPPPSTSMIILAPVLTVCLCLYVLGHQKDMARIYYLSWLLLLPSVLWYSRLDWLQVAGLPFNFQLFQTTLPFTEILIISLILVAGHVFLFYTSQLRNLNSELLSRGATEKDLEKVFVKMAAITTLYTVGSASGAALISLVISVLKSPLSIVIANVPYPYVIVGVTCIIMVPACLIIYLYSRAEIYGKKKVTPISSPPPFRASQVTEFMIWRFIQDHGGSVKKEAIIDALGKDRETRKDIEDKLIKMKVYGIVTITDDEIKTEDNVSHVPPLEGYDGVS